MRILRVVPSLAPEAGGVVSTVIASSTEMVRNGNEVVVVSLDNEHNGEHPFVVVNLGYSLFSTYRYSARLNEWLSENVKNFDCAIIEGLWQYSSFGAYRQIRKFDIPYIVFPHGMLDPWFNRDRLKYLKKQTYWSFAEGRVLKHAAKVVFTAEDEKLAAKKSFWPSVWDDEVIPLGLPDPPTVTTVDYSSLEKNFPWFDSSTLLFLGRLTNKKGGDLVVRALAKSKRRDFKVAFAGPDSEGLKRDWLSLARVHGVEERVFFCGLLTGELKWAALRRAAALILPSHQENFGMVVAEALSVGTPVLISNKVNIWREISNYNAGFVEDDDIAGTISLLDKYGGIGLQEQIALGENARRCFDSNFRLSDSTSKLLNLMRAICVT